MITEIKNKCKSCKFWTSEKSIFGKCSNAKARLSLNYSNLTELMTKSDFGCILHKDIPVKLSIERTGVGSYTIKSNREVKPEDLPIKGMVISDEGKIKIEIHK